MDQLLNCSSGSTTLSGCKKYRQIHCCVLRGNPATHSSPAGAYALEGRLGVGPRQSGWMWLRNTGLRGPKSVLNGPFAAKNDGWGWIWSAGDCALGRAARDHDWPGRG